MDLVLGQMDQAFFVVLNMPPIIPGPGLYAFMPPPNLLLPTQKQEQLFAYLDSIAEKKKEDLELFEIAETTSAQNWVRAHSYQNMESNALPTGLVAQMDFNSRTLTNSVSPQKKGKMGRQYSKKEHPVFTEGYKGAGLAMDHPVGKRP